VLGCGYALSIKNNDTIIVDGTEGIVLVNPGKNRIEEYKQKKEAYKTDAAQAIDNFFIEELKKL